MTKSRICYYLNHYPLKSYVESKDAAQGIVLIIMYTPVKQANIIIDYMYCLSNFYNYLFRILYKIRTNLSIKFSCPINRVFFLRFEFG